jgi:quercetin dioxygenase-like cupin family protein
LIDLVLTPSAELSFDCDDSKHQYEIFEQLAKVPNRQEIEQLQAEVAKMEQPVFDTEHYFSGGMYCRKLPRKAGTLIIGKVHKKEHFFMCAKGEIIAWTEKGMRKLSAGDIIECKTGTKRVTLALTDAIGITVHVTDKTNIDEIEADLVEPDELSMYAPGNVLKTKVLGS